MQSIPFVWFTASGTDYKRLPWKTNKTGTLLNKISQVFFCTWTLTISWKLSVPKNYQYCRRFLGLISNKSKKSSLACQFYSANNISYRIVSDLLACWELSTPFMVKGSYNRVLNVLFNNHSVLALTTMIRVDWVVHCSFCNTEIFNFIEKCVLVLRSMFLRLSHAVSSKRNYDFLLTLATSLNVSLVSQEHRLETVLTQFWDVIVRQWHHLDICEYFTQGRLGNVKSGWGGCKFSRNIFTLSLAYTPSVSW